MDIKQPQTVKVHRLITIVSEIFKVSVPALLSHSRPKHLATARLVTMALCREHTKHSLQNIASVFRRDHGAVIHAVKRLPQISADPNYAPLVQAVRTRIAISPPIAKVSKTSVQTSDLRAEFLKPNTQTFSTSHQLLAPTIRANSG